MVNLVMVTYGLLQLYELIQNLFLHAFRPPWSLYSIVIHEGHEKQTC
jgi:hypothetical protein